MARKNLLIATIIILTALAPFLAGAKNVEIQSIDLIPAQPLKGSLLEAVVNVKNFGTDAVRGKVEVSLTGPGIEISKSSTLSISSGSIVQFPSSRVSRELVAAGGWADFQESQVYTITAELSDTSSKLLDRKQATFVLGRPAAAVPEANPLLAALILGIVLGIFAKVKSSAKR